MGSFISKIATTVIFSLIVMYFYYGYYPFHNESFSGSYMMYILLLLIGYSIYKYFIIQFSENQYRLSFTWILLLSLAHLLILCLIFFSLSGGPLGYGLVLFFKILLYLLLPIFLSFLSHGVGEKVLSYIKGFGEEERFFRVVSSFGIGFFLLISILTISAFLSQFNILSFSVIISMLTIFSYKNIISNVKEILSLQFVTEAHDFDSNRWFKLLQPYLLSTEFLFVVITALLSVNLINVVRPFPIGWDDLGVYMNYANQIGHSGKMILFGQMSPWQVYTGIGYMLGSSPQAFFLNSFAGIISLLAIIFGVKDILSEDESKLDQVKSLLHINAKEKNYINIPLLMGAIYVSLPMVIFHLAKDMKLDQGLLFISIFGIYITLYTVLHVKNIKNILLYIGLAGIITGFAFSIKLTSLLMFFALIGLISFTELGILGFAGYVAIFFAIFTKFHLWNLLNVVYPKDNISFINIFTGVMSIIGVGLIVVSVQKRGRKKLQLLIQKICIYGLGFIVALSPWLAWNLGHIKDINIISLINGYSEGYNPDYTKIQTPEYIDKIAMETSMTASGKTVNEDLGRYFGYEDGINNYMKIWWNISMQVNQKGEFTEISYIFLALLPCLLLFLPLKSKKIEYTLYFSLISIISITLFPSINKQIAASMAHFELPFGYLFIIVPYILITLFAAFGIIDTQKRSKVFVYNTIMMSFYTFLWAISAFGIVWYGIAMYFFFIVSIALCLSFISTYVGDESNKENALKAIASYTIFGIISFYFVFSSYPHLFNNLSQTGYGDFKIGSVTEREAVFNGHPEYLDFLYETNIDKQKKNEFLAEQKKSILEKIEKNESNQQLIDIISNISDIKVFDKILGDIIKSPDIQDINLKNTAKLSRNELYSSIIYPDDAYKNNAIIYRVGTFMKYFINENHKRVFEDSLLFGFDQYIYDKNDAIIVERFKKLGVEDLLVDLNAATIDIDPRHALTKRYENMLLFFTSDKVQYIAGDSVCLSLAMNIYNASKKSDTDKAEYLLLAGTNYDSYSPTGEVIPRNQKLANCFSKIKESVINNQVNDKSPDFLKNLYNYYKSPESQLKTDDDWMNLVGRGLNPGFKVILKLK